MRNIILHRYFMYGVDGIYNTIIKSSQHAGLFKNNKLATKGSMVFRFTPMMHEILRMHNTAAFHPPKKTKVRDKVVGLGRTKSDRYGYKIKKKEKTAGLLTQEGRDIVLDKIDFSKIDLLPINQTSYKPTIMCLSRPHKEVECYKKTNEIIYRNGEIPNPIIEFDDYEFPPYIKDRFKQYGFKSPLPIQSYAWPAALQGRDFIGISRTGSGKSLGFLIPLLIHVALQEPVFPGEGPIGLVIVPTVELCDQLYTITRTFTDSTSIRCMMLHSGARRESQVRDLRKGIEICFATPGRLVTLLHSKETDLLRCSFVIIDEADKLLDCGLDSQIMEIFSQCHPNRQTLMFSATWPLSFAWLIKKVLVDEMEIFIGSSELSTNINIKQHFHVCKFNDVQEKILEILDIIATDGWDQPYKILMFANNSMQADKFEKLINSQNKEFVVDVIHGARKPEYREKILSRFRSGHVNFLIATDIAARGLDVDDISHVINVGFPFTCEHYIHRIGRTGRVGKKGIAHTLVYKMDKDECSRLIDHLEDHKQHVNVDLLQFLNAPKTYRGKRFKWQ